MFMLKLLAILFFMYYFINMFTHHSFLKKATIEFIKDLKATISYENSTSINNNFMKKDSFAMIGISGIFIAALDFIQVVYVLFSIKHDPYKYISISYLIFLLIILLISIVEQKISKFNYNDLHKYTVIEALKELNNQIEKIEKVSITGIIQTIINTTFFGYMIYILFIR